MFSCNGWGCSDCGPRKSRTVKALLLAAAEEMGLVNLYSLTMPSWVHKLPSKVSRRLSSQWWHLYINKVRKRLEDGFHYTRTPEPHKERSIAHIHFASDASFTQQQLEADWASIVLKHSPKNRICGFRMREGDICVMERGHGGHTHQSIRCRASPQNGQWKDRSGAARYVVKYITKNTGESTSPWDGYRCMKSGRHRKVPWHRWSSDAETTRVIKAIKETRMAEHREHSGRCPSVVRYKPNKDPVFCMHKIGHEGEHLNDWTLVREIEAMVPLPEILAIETQRLYKFVQLKVPAWTFRRVDAPMASCPEHKYGSFGDCHVFRAEGHFAPENVRSPECGITCFMEGSTKSGPKSSSLSSAAPLSTSNAIGIP